MTRVLRASLGEVMNPDGTFDVAKLRECGKELAEVAIVDTPQVGRSSRVGFRDPIAAADRLAKLQGRDRPAQIEVATANAQDLAAMKEAFRTMTPAERAAWLKANIP